MILIFIYQYYKYYNIKESDDNIIKSLLFLSSGIILGWMNENMFFAQCLFILVIV
ncbi:DUF6056 family protein [uncultured Apibacter sp.]|uniref:DUF6056 family protein n=1 Tax=uncultured Apibacter sp. TaxID=1778616 RepID=UPI003457EE72